MEWAKGPRAAGQEMGWADGLHVLLAKLDTVDKTKIEMMAVDIGFIPSSNINSCHQVKKKKPFNISDKNFISSKIFLS